MDMGERVDRIVDDLLSTDTVPAGLLPEGVEPSSGVLTHRDVIDLMERVYQDPWGEGLDNPLGDQADMTRGEAKRHIFAGLLEQAVGPQPRRLSEDVLEAGTYAYYRLPEQYATQPREYVQGEWGGGKPYSTHNPFHFTNRYGMSHRPPNWTRVWLGVFKDVPMECARAAERDRQSREMIRFYMRSITDLVSRDTDVRREAEMIEMFRLLSGQ